MLFFEYLRLSPSYGLAKRDVKGLLDPECTLPSYFSEVQSTYALLGDVHRVLFRLWWRQRGIKAFGMAVPKGGEPAQRAAGVANPVLSFEGDRFRWHDVYRGLRVLTFRVARPDWELWRIGAMSEVGYDTTRDKRERIRLDPRGPREVSGPEEVEAREIVTKATIRALQRAEARAENAARGHFPCDDQVDHSLFNYRMLRKRKQALHRWEKSEMDRLLASQLATDNRANE
ncbi:hypothetical protein FN976_28370 [Caenimonas sedimenti]|uniref:Uncharacterized protein n=1 Tax=Caenimonas sedimenti TaxID=2596921 RepID=A0A562ZDL0_9BURK|nr:hypothetical protein [Caenimonas sedimenti]TWO64003.1 hypothetical protein FN976_28370 [Caenimonas sedimenti]